MSILVLVVEDEPLVRMIAVETLEDAGFRTAEAATAKEALKLLDDKGAGFGAAIVDIGLPDIPGDELVLRLRRQHPLLPIVVASGYDRGRVPSQILDDPRVRVIEKPYENAALIMTLGDLGMRGGDPNQDH